MDYPQALDYLLSFTDMERGYQASPNPTMSLASMRSLLARLGDPHLGRPTVHVTGSKGKGSTSSMIAGILQQAGFRTTLYTSPHLHAFTERISIDGAHVSPEEFAAGIEAIQPAITLESAAENGNVTTFGILTALYFWLTRAQVPPIDWQIVEVGLGGTFDATNVFDATDVAVITPISLEHTAILGKTCEAIAQDKAGIIKPGSTCILAPQQDPAVVRVVRERCAEAGATFVNVAALYDARPLERHPFGQSFEVSGPTGVRTLRTPMLGRHQLQNAATAVAAADAIIARGHTIPESAIAEGIARVRVPGRMEVMGQRPLIIADGAHNGESAAALAAALREYFEFRRCFLVMGMNSDKNANEFAFKLASLADLIICVGFNNPRAMDPYALVQEAGFLGPAAVAEPTVAAGIDTALSHAAPEDAVVITGSLYVVAEAREYLLGESATGG